MYVFHSVAYIICYDGWGSVRICFYDVGRIDALLKPACKWSFSRDTVTLKELSNKSVA